MAHMLRPHSEPLPVARQQRGQKVLEALNGLVGKDQLELACRTVLAVLMAVQSRFQGENELVFNDRCSAVLQWLTQEMQPLRFARPQCDSGEKGRTSSGGCGHAPEGRGHGDPQARGEDGPPSSDWTSSGLCPAPSLHGNPQSDPVQSDP